MENSKLGAARAALDFVEDGMKLGLGTGSTAAIFVDLLGERVKDGLNVTCVPTSEATRIQAEKLGIPLTTLDEVQELDLTVDGADEISEDLALIKGGGGALLREKIVAHSSRKVVIIADESKLVDQLGAFPLPVEVVQFGYKATMIFLKEIATIAECEGSIELRLKEDGTPFVTDGGNYVLDFAFTRLDDPHLIEDVFINTPGVVTTGFFFDMADFAILGKEDGVDIIELTYEAEEV